MRINKLFMILVIAIGCSNAEASPENRERRHCPEVMKVAGYWVCASALSTGLCTLRAWVAPDSENPRNEVDGVNFLIIVGTSAAMLTGLMYRDYKSQQRLTRRDSPV